MSDPKVDVVSGVDIRMDYPHHEIHGGNSYLVQEGISLNDAAKSPEIGFHWL